LLIGGNPGILAAMTMSIEMVRAFCLVVDRGGFRAAATALGRTQPAVSQQVKALERQVGQVLLDRRKARPTAAGRRLLPGMRLLLQSAESLEREAQDLAAGHAAVLRVGTSDTTALYTLPATVQRFTRAWPAVRLELINRSTAALAGLVLEGQLDVAIVTLPVAEAGLEEEELFAQPLVAAVPEGHALSARKRLRPEDLHEAPMLLLDKTTRTGARIHAWFQEEGIAPQVLADSGSFEVLKRFSAAGVGLAILPAAMMATGAENLRAVPVPGLPAIPIGALWRAGAYRLEAAEAFVALLRH